MIVPIAAARRKRDKPIDIGSILTKEEAAMVGQIVLERVNRDLPYQSRPKAKKRKIFL